jgi:hypothetical protein
MADEHASIAVSTLVARSQRSDGVSAALANRQRTSNMPADRIQASGRDLSVTYNFDMVPAFSREPNDGRFGYYPRALNRIASLPDIVCPMIGSKQFSCVAGYSIST